MSAYQPTIVHNCRQLIEIFHASVGRAERTRLCMGAPEPEYRAARSADEPHCIHFTRDYFASALHEVAHWCVAGPERRRRDDYGYWYSPDGRSAEQQAEFERVEVRPQALEWLFSEAAGWRFRVSADNLALDMGPSEAFKDAIHERVRHHCHHGVNSRAGAFLTGLIGHYRSARDLADLLRAERFARESL